jgi:hypothetical protein
MTEVVAEMTRDCPRCAESIKAKALVCPHCRADLDEGKRSLNRAALLAVAAIFFAGWIYENPPEFTQSAPIGPVATATLEKAFDDDRAAAMARFGNRPILVDGSVSSVHSDRVTLDTIFLLHVQAYFKGSTYGVPLGRVRLRCDSVTFQDYFGSAKPLLNGCRLAD